jgi:hypothetical protein
MGRGGYVRLKFLTIVMWWSLGALPAVVLPAGCGRAKPPEAESSVERPEQSVPERQWVRPGQGLSSEPLWGLKENLAVGLWPASGPRGLIRIYAPYLGQRYPRMVNFIAVEPVVNGVRGQSELEIGSESGQSGLTMWSSDTPISPGARETSAPSPGRIERRDGTEVLTFYVAMERFRNGARPYLQVLLRADRPHEVGFRVYAADGGAPMEACVLSATMGNYSRLRRLWLCDEVVDARKLWPTFDPDRLGFAPWRSWGRGRLLRQGGDIIVAARSDEADPSQWPGNLLGRHRTDPRRRFV